MTGESSGSHSETFDHSTVWGSGSSGPGRVPRGCGLLEFVGRDLEPGEGPGERVDHVAHLEWCEGTAADDGLRGGRRDLQDPVDAEAHGEACRGGVGELHADGDQALGVLHRVPGAGSGGRSEVDAGEPVTAFIDEGLAPGERGVGMSLALITRSKFSMRPTRWPRRSPSTVAEWPSRHSVAACSKVLSATLEDCLRA